MDVVYRRGEASVSDVLAELPDPPSYSAVRALLRVLAEKGHVHHREDGPRYLYRPAVAAADARASALRRLVGTFFGGSPALAVTALLDLDQNSLDDAELDRLARRIEEARQKES